MTTRRNASRVWAGSGALAAALPILLIVILSGDTLTERINELLDNGTTSSVRLALWASAERMIVDAPF